jgi:hypothetical protein
MALKKWGFIYTLDDPSALQRTDILGSQACEMVCIGISNVADAPETARKLLAQGVELIELCGAFGGQGLGEVIAAVHGKVPVGAVFYGCDASGGLQRLFGQ